MLVLFFLITLQSFGTLSIAIISTIKKNPHDSCTAMFYRNFMGFVFYILMFDMQKESLSLYATKQFVGGI